MRVSGRGRIQYDCARCTSEMTATDTGEQAAKKSARKPLVLQLGPVYRTVQSSRGVVFARCSGVFLRYHRNIRNGLYSVFLAVLVRKNNAHCITKRFRLLFYGPVDGTCCRRHAVLLRVEEVRSLPRPEPPNDLNITHCSFLLLSLSSSFATTVSRDTVIVGDPVQRICTL
jgi:hypothetical protein